VQFDLVNDILCFGFESTYRGGIMEYKARPPIDVDIANGRLNMDTANRRAVEAIQNKSNTKEYSLKQWPKEDSDEDDGNDFGPINFKKS